MIVYNRSTVTIGTLSSIGLISTRKLKPPLLNKDISRIFAAFYTTALIQVVHGRQVQFLWRLLLRVAVQVPDEMEWRDTHPRHEARNEHCQCYNVITSINIKRCSCSCSSQGRRLARRMYCCFRRLIVPPCFRVPTLTARRAPRTNNARDL